MAAGALAGLWFAWALGAAHGPSEADSAAGIERVQRVTVPFPLAEWRAIRAAAPVDPEDETARPAASRLLLVGQGGELRLWLGEGGALATAPGGRAALAVPDRSLLAVGGALLGPGEPPALVVLSPRGLGLLVLDPEGLEAEAPTVLERRARFDLSVGAPRFAPLLQDVDGDGRLDALVPAPRSVELWLQRPPEAVPDVGAAESDGKRPLPRFERAARVRVETASSAQADAAELSDRLRASFAIPGLLTDDLNGDGRPDLIVIEGARHAFHLQREDGSFPLDPDVSVDLSLFRDGTGPSRMRLGGTLTLGEEAQLTRRDLDRDGIPDFVIAQGRKVWVFHGGPEGPQFQNPSAILQTADDVTAVAIAHLDGDEWPDLLLLRIELPSVPTLLMGLVTRWDVPVRAVGYRNLDGRRFELRPSFRADLALRLPPIFELLRDPYALIERFRGVGAKFREALIADLSGSGSRDLVLVGEDGARIDVWYGRGLDGDSLGEREVERQLADQLFGQSDNVWDLDRLLGWIEASAARRDARLTAGRSPDLSAALELPAGARLERVEVLRPAGAEQDRLLVAWRRPDGTTGFDLLRIRR